MNGLVKAVVVAVIVVVTAACPPPAGSPSPDPPPPSSATYVVGYYHDGTHEVPAIWSDGDKTDLSLPMAATDGRATDVIVAGADVIVSGHYVLSGDTIACYWTNGVRTDVSSSGASYEATGVAHGDGSVHISGREMPASPALPTAYYWEDGGGLPLAGPAANAIATGAGFDNGVALVSGHFDNGTTLYTATLWRTPGGATPEIDLSLSDLSEAFGVVVGSDGNYYVSGNFWKTVGTVSNYTSAYWAVDSTSFSVTRTELYADSTQTGRWSKGVGIDKFGGTVCTAGYFTDASGEHPAYWRDTVRQDVGASSGRASGIATTSAGITVVGYLDNGGDRKSAFVWKDGAVETLYDSGTTGEDAEALAVYVVP